MVDYCIKFIKTDESGEHHEVLRCSIKDSNLYSEKNRTLQMAVRTSKDGACEVEPYLIFTDGYELFNHFEIAYKNQPMASILGGTLENPSLVNSLLFERLLFMKKLQSFEIHGREASTCKE